MLAYYSATKHKGTEITTVNLRPKFRASTRITSRYLNESGTRSALGRAVTELNSELMVKKNKDF